MINQVEEGAREMVTARRGYKCPPSTVEPFAEGVESIPRCGPTLPNSLSTMPLSLQREGDGRRESVDFHVYADMYFKTSISTAPRPRERILRYFRFTMEDANPPSILPRAGVAMNHCEQSIIRHLCNIQGL